MLVFGSSAAIFIWSTLSGTRSGCSSLPCGSSWRHSPRRHGSEEAFPFSLGLSAVGLPFWLPPLPPRSSLGRLESLSTTAAVVCCPAWCAAIICAPSCRACTAYTRAACAAASNWLVLFVILGNAAIAGNLKVLRQVAPSLSRELFLAQRSFCFTKT